MFLSYLVQDPGSKTRDNIEFYFTEKKASIQTLRGNPVRAYGW